MRLSDPMRPIELVVLNVLHQIAPASHREVALLAGVSAATAHRVMFRLKTCGAIQFHSFEFSSEKALRPRHLYAPILIGPKQKAVKKRAPNREEAILRAEKHARQEAARIAADAPKPITDPWGRPVNKGAV